MFLSLAWAGEAEPSGVIVVNLEGTITSMSVELVGEAVAYAEENSQTVILMLNTPGGSLDATFKIIDIIRDSKVPVIGYVYPEGSKAWSAGTYILMATHIAAMAPHTVIGSCQPVAFNPLGGTQPVNETKTINALTAYMVEEAKAHNRNETAAKLFVAENLNLDSEEALNYGVVEIVAESLDSLLKEIDGRTVKTRSGLVEIEASSAYIKYWKPSFRLQVLQFLSEPMIAYILLTIGLYALIFGFATPGHGGEVVGAVLLILGLIGLGITGINVGALILIIVGAVLLIAELLTPGFGLMGGAGFACVILGGVFLFPGSWAVETGWLNALFTVIIVAPVIFGGFFIFSAYKVLKVRRRKPFHGEIIGEEAEALDNIASGKYGFVRFRGEYWKALGKGEVKAGQKVKIVGKEGPILIVEAEAEK
jgi:membrane-bound serine protease (ClpP class)